MMRAVIALALGTMLAAAAAAGQTASADWPCIQPRQPHLSLGQVWAGPAPDDAARAAAADPATAALAERIAQRRMPLDQAEAEIDRFARGRDAAALTALMLAVFNDMDAYRTRLLDGIARYGRKQVALADRVRARRDRMALLQAAGKPDFDAIDAEEKALELDERIFNDRRQSLGYVCESPVIVEQRLFALGRAIAAHLPTP